MAPTPAKLAARLDRYGFWTRKVLDADVAASAVTAAKRFAAEPQMTAVLPTLQRAAHSADARGQGERMLERMYAHPQIVSLVPQIWPALFITQPVPPLRTSSAIMRQFCAGRSMRSLPLLLPALHALVRREIGLGNYVESLNLLDFAPKKLDLHFWGGLACAVSGIASTMAAGCFALSWPLGAIAGIFWAGLAYAFLEPMRYPRVEWIASVPLMQRYKSHAHIRLANQIVTGFEEIGSVNIANFHQNRDARHLGQEALGDIECIMDGALRRRGLQRRPMIEAQLYADYWSADHERWQHVEWHEPDQDPAYLQH